MKRRQDRTAIGGTRDVFQTTQWSQILGAQVGDGLRQKEALGTVLAQYWKPVYAYIRRKFPGRGNEEAKDLTQGFFEAVLRRNLILEVDPARGRFRSYLLTALQRYLTDQYRRETARKRAPDEGLVSLDGLDSGSGFGVSADATPEQAYTLTWARQLLHEVLLAVEARCLEAGQDKHWQVFRRTVVEPTLTGDKPPRMADLADELGIENEVKAANLNVTVRRRFRAALSERVREFPLVETDEDVDREIRELMAILSR